jgi:DUF1009 family protein
MPSPYGILAGSGDLPSVVAQELKERNRDVVAAFINPDVPDDLRNSVEVGRFFKPEHFGEVPEFFLDHNVEELVMVGGVDRSLLYDEDRLDNADETVSSELASAETKEDEELIRTAVELLESFGLTVTGIDQLLESKLSPSGHQAGPPPKNNDCATVNQLADVAIALADHEVGQTVLGKHQSTVAVEAAEGTNRTIRRAGELAGDGLVMIKVARSHQDFRLDVPVVGASTVRELVQAGGRLLAVEADRTLWVQREECRRLADRNQLTIMGWSRD